MANLSYVHIEETVEDQGPASTAIQRSETRSSNHVDNSDPASPYFLHSSENPSLVLVSTLMNGKNYHGWARAIKMASISKNKFSFVNGDISAPNPSDSQYAAWERCNTNGSLMDELYRLRQGDSSVSDYYTRIKILWDELEALQPTPTCTCVRPCYSIASDVKNIREKDYSIRFLKGLNDQFSNVRSQIMLMNPLPLVNRVFSLIMQQERQLHLEGVFNNQEVHKAFYNSNEQVQGRVRFQARGRGRGSFTGKGRSGSSRLCTYCGKTSHIVETCFEKHGYPPGYKQKGATHKANVAVVPKDQMQASMEGIRNPSHIDLQDGFTNSQYQTTLEMIQQSLQ
ncbi:uncharacterized protein LOC133310301 [Gastrolobium bilobum]|uniref:uncharacterized protein LOC133310301 n=1 Tax=Gastrolobium bilobum TaxID=150636 RepID=UPI002AAF7F90|nr:uncharacterized protein LOC133310301 [Gastrolobium bilobum]